MKYYKGACDDDIPYNGGSFVEENGYGHEEHNFNAVTNSEDGKDYCLGFVETKATNKDKHNELHIEKIDGCALMKKEEAVEDVLVIWCATTDLNETSIIGWYDHATVYRNYQETEVDGEISCFNIKAEKENCVLIPCGDRHQFCWKAPVARKKTYGFGQSMIWFPTDEKGRVYAEEKAKLIRAYNGENWIDVFPKGY